MMAVLLQDRAERRALGQHRPRLSPKWHHSTAQCFFKNFQPSAAEAVSEPEDAAEKARSD